MHQMELITPYLDQQLIYFSGTQTNVPDEMNSTIDALVGTNFKRCAAGANADNPTMNTTGGAWNPNNIISDSYEAKIIGGAITADKNDYSSGFFLLQVQIIRHITILNTVSLNSLLLVQVFKDLIYL